MILRRLTRPIAIFAAAALLLPLFGHLGVRAAGGGNMYLYATPSSSSATADGSSKITVSVYAYYNRCADGYWLDTPPCPDGSTPTEVGLQRNIIITAPGDVAVGGAQTWTDGKPYVTTGADGRTQFTLASSSAGSKQVSINFSEESPSASNGVQTVSVTFNAPAAPKATTKPKSTATTPAPEPTPPAAPQTSTMEIAGQPVADATQLTIENDAPLVLKGKTVANGVVKLYIFSTPREATVTADAEGNWSYTVQGLEPGSHHVEAEVTDPATQKTSARATLAAFTVKAPMTKVTATAQAAKPAKRSLVGQLWFWIVIALVVLGGVAAAWWFWWRKRKASKPKQDSDTPTTITPNSTGSDTDQRENS